MTNGQINQRKLNRNCSLLALNWKKAEWWTNDEMLEEFVLHVLKIERCTSSIFNSNHLEPTRVTIRSDPLFFLSICLNYARFFRYCVFGVNQRLFLPPSFVASNMRSRLLLTSFRSRNQRKHIINTIIICLVNFQMCAY